MKMVGFDRRIRLEWLDEVAFHYYKSRDQRETASHMKQYLLQYSSGAEARRKFYDILKRVWVDVPPQHEVVRNKALELFIESNASTDRLAVHWGMILITYPFFCDVADSIGQSVAIQDEVPLSNIYKKTVENWGERSTVKHAMDKLVGSLWQWGVLDKKTKGVYTHVLPVDIAKPYQLWLVESKLRSENVQERPLFEVLTSKTLFPFNINLNKNDIHEYGAFEISRQGMDREIISFR